MQVASESSNVGNAAFDRTQLIEQRTLILNLSAISQMKDGSFVEVVAASIRVVPKLCSKRVRINQTC